MFVAQEIALPTGYKVAAGRLAHVVAGEALDGASVAAYEYGLNALMRVGPFGASRPLSKLVQVQALPPVPQGAATTVALRWHATGLAGEMFPALDADLVLTPDGRYGSRLKLVASYRPPLGWAGAALDKAIMHRVAGATIRTLLQQVADLISEHPPPLAQPGPEPTRCRQRAHRSPA